MNQKQDYNFTINYPCDLVVHHAIKSLENIKRLPFSNVISLNSHNTSLISPQIQLYRWRKTENKNKNLQQIIQNRIKNAEKILTAARARAHQASHNP